MRDLSVGEVAEILKQSQIIIYNCENERFYQTTQFSGRNDAAYHISVS